MTSLRRLAVVYAVVPGCDLLQRLFSDHCRFPLVRMGSAAVEVYVMGSSIGNLRGCKDCEHRGKVMFVDVADAILHAQYVFVLRIVLAVGDNHDDQVTGHLEPLATLSPLLGADFGVQFLPVLDAVVSSYSSFPHVYVRLHEALLRFHEVLVCHWKWGDWNARLRE